MYTSDLRNIKKNRINFFSNFKALTYIEPRITDQSQIDSFSPSHGEPLVRILLRLIYKNYISIVAVLFSVLQDYQFLLKQ